MNTDLETQVAAIPETDEDVHAAPSAEKSAMLASLSNRYKLGAVIWIVIAISQIIIGINSEWFIALVGGINLYSAITDITYSKTLLTNPVGVVDKERPLVESLISLCYNAAFGGVVGVLGVAYYLAAIRNFVLQNEQIFAD